MGDDGGGKGQLIFSNNFLETLETCKLILSFDMLCDHVYSSFFTERFSINHGVVS